MADRLQRRKLAKALHSSNSKPDLYSGMRYPTLVTLTALALGKVSKKVVTVDERRFKPNLNSFCRLSHDISASRRFVGLVRSWDNGITEFS